MRTRVRVLDCWMHRDRVQDSIPGPPNPAPLSQQHRLVLDVGALASQYQTPGQFVQAKRRPHDKPGFFAIASPPNAEAQTLELLLKAAGPTAELLCGLDRGEAARGEEGKRMQARLPRRRRRVEPGKSLR